MKYLLLILLWGSIANATTFQFIFTVKRDTVTYKTDAKTWDEAFERAALFCANYIPEHYKLTPEEIVDICVNPKEKK